MGSITNFATKIDANGNLLGTGGYFDSIPFVARLASDGSFVWSAFLGTTFSAADIKLDSVGNPVVTGYAHTAERVDLAAGNWGSPPHPYIADSYSSYIASLDKDTGALLWHDFFGKNASATKMALDKNDTIYISGDTTSSWGAPLKNMYRAIVYCPGGTVVDGFHDTFVVRMDKSGAGWNIAWNTFLGTFSPASSIALDESAGYLYILSGAGMANGCEYPGAFYTNGANGAMIYQLAPSGAATGRYAMLDVPVPVTRLYGGVAYDGWSILVEPAGTLLVAADNLNVARINFNIFISGVVKDSNGTPVSGAVISTDLGISAVSGANGAYRMQIPNGSSLTLTVSYPGATSPASVTLSKVTASKTQDFTFSGTVTAWGVIVIDGVSSPQRLYTALDGKGVYWRLKDTGSWSAATTQPANKAFRGLVISPASPSTLFAATYGGGVFKSINSGVDWAACTNTGLSSLNLLTLVADSAGKLYAGTEAGVYSSSDCASWTAVNTGLP